MDERFLIGKRVPKDALKAITGNGAKLSDINPQWRIEVMTEIYGLCGLGWKYEVGEPLIQPTNNDVMIFLPVSLYIKDNETKEWSAPITAYGGDYLVRNGKGKEEGYKGCLTDALGKAMSYIGIASDIYRGCWDGSKYSDKTVVDQGTNGQQETPGQQIPDNLAQAQEELGGEVTKIEPVRTVEGRTQVWYKGGYRFLDRAGLESLNDIINTKEFAACHEEARMLMLKRKE